MGSLYGYDDAHSKARVFNSAWFRAVVSAIIVELSLLQRLHLAARGHIATILFAIALYIGVQVLLRAGRHLVPSRNIAQQRISSLRATATIAIFLRALLPRRTRSYTARIQEL